MATGPDTAKVTFGNLTFSARNFWLVNTVILSYLNLVPILLYIIQRGATRWSGVSGIPEDEAPLSFNNSFDAGYGYLTIDAKTATQNWRLIYLRPKDDPSANRVLGETTGTISYTTFKLGPSPSNLPRSPTFLARFAYMSRENNFG